MKLLGMKLVTASVAIILGFGAAPAQNQTDPLQNDKLRSGFENPPKSARPRVWWHWMNGNITKEGIKLDLEWMHRVGLAGFQNFDAALQTPQVVEHRLAYMTPEWKDAFKYATTLADQLGLEEAIAGSPGWSEIGRPVGARIRGHEEICVERDARGGRQAVLRNARASAGEDRRVSEPGHPRCDASEALQPIPQFYADAAVIAYKRAASDVPWRIAARQDYCKRRLAGPCNTHRRRPGEDNQVPIPAEGEIAWIQYEFPSRRRIRAITFVTKDPERDCRN